MSKPTWGLYVPGYSSPSPQQTRLFAKQYPDVVAWHSMEQEQREREIQAEEAAVRRRYYEKQQMESAK